MFSLECGEVGRGRRRREGSGECLNSFSNDLGADGGLPLSKSQTECLNWARFAQYCQIMCSAKGWAMLIQDNSEKWLHSYRRAGGKFLPQPSRPCQSHSQWPFKANSISCQIKVWKPSLIMQIFSPSSLRADPLPCGSVVQDRAAPWEMHHLHSWKVGSTWERCLWDLLLLLDEKK